MSDLSFVPASTISPEARAYFVENFSRQRRNALVYPAPADFAGWVVFNQRSTRERAAHNEALKRRYAPVLVETQLGGVPVLDIRPRSWSGSDKVLLYTHGGGYVEGLATDSLDSVLPLADESGLRVISVSYTLAPQARFDQVTDETTAVARALMASDRAPQDIAILGDSAGGGLAAATALKLRDQTGDILAAAALWSPWTDLTGSGDTHLTLAEFEPFFRYDALLRTGAEAYAGPDQLDHPYASPLFGDFKSGYPPTLIQAGTRELILSDSVRLYQALEDAGQAVCLDIYEGMWHVFQFQPIDTPEARLARRKTARFLLDHLGE